MLQFSTVLWIGTKLIKKKLLHFRSDWGIIEKEY